MGVKDKVNRVKVQIFNDEYVIRGQEDEKHIELVAEFVDLQMKQIALLDPALSPKNLAVLAAVNLADELIKIKRDYEELIMLLDSDKKK